MTKDIPLALYKKIHKAMPIACVDAVIMHEGKVLLGRRTNKPAKDMWWFLGGRICKGETLNEAIVRKIYQELGVEINIIAQLGVAETMFEDGPFGWATHTVNIVFLVELKDAMSAIRLDGQHDDYQWFGTAQRDFHPYVKKYITLAKKAYE